MSNFRKALLLSMIVLLFAGSVFAEQVEGFVDESDQQEFPQLRVTKKSYPAPTADLVSAIEPIRVADPYVTAGQPFIIEFTLENIGDELGFPFNQIALSPDQYALVLMADNQYDHVILPNGTSFDLWGKMDPWEKFSFGIATSLDSFGSYVATELEGRDCGYVNVWPFIPIRIQNEITQANGGHRPAGLYNWSCVKLIDEDYFNSKVSTLCGGVIDSKCLAEINNRTYVGDTLQVGLVSTTPKNSCQRLSLHQDFWGRLGGTITGRGNFVDCGLGENGLPPGQEVTFSFIGLVPADAPVLSPADFAEVTEINEGYTQSASCLGTDYPENCHTIYAGVYPLRKENAFNTIVNGITGILSQGAGIIVSTLYNLDTEAGIDAAITGGGIMPRAVGEPIWEGRGIFFVVGPGLKGSINLILMLTLVVAGLTGASFKRRTG